VGSPQQTRGLKRDPPGELARGAGTAVVAIDPRPRIRPSGAPTGPGRARSGYLRRQGGNLCSRLSSYFLAIRNLIPARPQPSPPVRVSSGPRLTPRSRPGPALVVTGELSGGSDCVVVPDQRLRQVWTSRAKTTMLLSYSLVVLFQLAHVIILSSARLTSP
jgi:hypothetical protein